MALNLQDLLRKSVEAKAKVKQLQIGMVHKPSAVPLQIIETLAIGAAGGLLFLWGNLPGGLISGAMIAVGIAAFAGRPMTMPPILTQGSLLLLGIALGSLASKQLLSHISAYPVTIALLALATFCSTFGSSVYLQRFHGWDRTSAFLAGSPGAMSQITILAAEKGADVAGIAVVQTMRLIILTAALPLLLAMAGLGHADIPAAVVAIASPLELMGLIAISIAVALILRLMKFPAVWMFGAMIGSSLLHGAGIVEGSLPPWLRAASLIGLGAVIGARFAKVKAETLIHHLYAALGSFAVAVLITAGFVGLASLDHSVRLSDVMVAFAPGAMDAMMALALTLHIDPIFVGAHHLSRFLYVTIATPGIVHLFGRPQDDMDD